MVSNQKGYTVKQLAKMAGVSVRTLHHYDAMGLLTPTLRTTAGYRLYGQAELLRLQQILFYKELDFPLKEIQELLDTPGFDAIPALQQHREALHQRKQRLNTLLDTIDKTILQLKGEKQMTNEELYAGFGKEKASAIRKDAIEKYGEEAVLKSENNLKAKGKERFEALKKEGEEITATLTTLMHQPPESPEVQAHIARHYAHIQQMWGDSVPAEKQLEVYGNLGDLYVSDNRFYANAPEGFTTFMRDAMRVFAGKD